MVCGTVCGVWYVYVVNFSDNMWSVACGGGGGVCVCVCVVI